MAGLEVVTGAAEEVVGAAGGVVEAMAGAAVAAHAHTASAEDWTVRPTAAPQARTTQERAFSAMAAALSGLHEHL